MDLPEEIHLGVAGLVTDSEGILRLMVCSKKDCLLWKGSEWETGHSMNINR